MKNILTLKEHINRTKKLMNIFEVSDVYSNIEFVDNVVGNSRPSQDNINTALLDDVQTAAKNAGVTVDVTTAVSGHNSLPSRHPSGNAIDIAIINNKSVSINNRDDADKFVNELIKLGYIKNVEKGNPKAVLTFGFSGHDNHVHVSNTSGSSTSPDTSEPDSEEINNVLNAINNNVDSYSMTSAILKNLPS